VIRFLLLSILILLIARTFWRVMDGVIQAAGGRPASRGEKPLVSAIKLVRDPVCGTFVTPGRAVSYAPASGGVVQHFCSERCRDEFVSGTGAGRPRSHAS
jgi:YHS domain-containing protein